MFLSKNASKINKKQVLLLDLGTLTIWFGLSFALFYFIGFAFLPFFSFCVYLIFAAFALLATKSSVISRNIFQNALKIGIALSTTFVATALVSWFFVAPSELSLICLLLFYLSVLNFISLLLFRSAFLAQINDKNNAVIRVLLYGCDAIAINTATFLKTNLQQPYKVVGYVSSDSAITNTDQKLPVYKTISAIPFHLIDVVVIPKTASNQSKINELVDAALSHKIKVLSSYQPASSSKNKATFVLQPFSVIDLLGRDVLDFDQENILKSIKNKVVLISGAAGSIGSELAKQVILYQPKQLILLDFAESALHDLFIEMEFIAAPNVVFPVIGDIRDLKFLHKLFNTYKPQLLFHAAAYKHVPLMQANPFQAVQTNVFGTKNLADLSVQFEIEKFVFISTDKAVNPSSIMGASKRIAEQYLQLLNQQKNSQFIITRFGNVLGSNGSVVPLFEKQIAKGGPVTVTHQDVIRYFMTLSEACLLVLEASALGKGGEVFLFDMGEPVKIIDLAHKMILLAGYEPEREIKMQFIGLRPGEKLFEELHTVTSKTETTYHAKITIAKETWNLDKLLHEMQDLEHVLYQKSDIELVEQMQKMVPEFELQHNITCCK
ncbi:polysaccharide biosynthesis protein [Flavobacterium agricola]|uniref:Polysaccharide biosynthesis protein n=1 Tax=Flavobacterium agricola TaxID=2870839 RepID=A0ABY6LWA2_9FLAO|nr:polysaccharide biosynthesis protein [Flavobacterium agricola]UYW00521.1 polysaccharide biosynthesis protein [Flavobacterium agricola]